MSVAAFHSSRADAIVVALTTNLQGARFGDYDLEDWQAAGLPRASRVKAVVQTVDRTTIEYQFGTLTPNDFAHVEDSVRQVMGL